MSERSQEYFDRFRGRRNFTVGVLLGALVGSLTSVVLQLLQAQVPSPYSGAFTAGIVVAIVASALYASGFARNSESIELMYVVSIDPESASSLARELRLEIEKKKSQLPTEFPAIADSVLNLMGSEKALEQADLKILKAVHGRVLSAIPKSSDGTTRDLLTKCGEYLKRIEDMTSLLVGGAKELIGDIPQSNELTVESTVDGFAIAKKRILFRWMIRRFYRKAGVVGEVMFKSNPNSLVSPSNAYVKISPPPDINEYHQILDDLGFLFEKLGTTSDLNLLGIKFATEEETQIEQIVKESMRPITSMFDEILGRLPGKDGKEEVAQ